jgi:hypothetical protein
MPPDRLNAVGVLTRREIEARIVAPLVEALGERFGQAEVQAVLRETILRLAREQGAQLAVSLGGNTLTDFARNLELWTRDDAMTFTVTEQTPARFAFQVTRCRYAELYRALGIADLGVLLSCNRDAALMAGFNPAVVFTRTQTIMEGAPYCDFCYAIRG